MQIGGKRVYLDYAAAAPIRSEVREVMKLWEEKNFANPSALYREAEEAKKALEEARAAIARIVGVKAGEVVFVSGSTEANNSAIFGVTHLLDVGCRVVTTAIEHPSILEPVSVLEREGWQVSRLSVDGEGFINLKDLEKTLPDRQAGDSALVTLAWANSDLGVIQPILEIGNWKLEINGKAPLFHVDASQAGGLLELKHASRVAGLVTISSSKIGGPRGIAALIVKSGVKLEPIIYGGGQERSLRSGTENVAAAIGFAKALELAEAERVQESERLAGLRDQLIEGVLTSVEGVRLTGPRKERLSNHASFVFENIDGEELVIRLDEAGFAVGTGSACATSDYKVERGTLRVTLGRETKKEDIENFVQALIKILLPGVDFSLS